jgi:predicted DNA-binding protein (UPF0251 family)/predicted Fe-Mo cluster-binding NifX family protein
MPRPTRCRRIAQLPTYRSFSPDEIEPSEEVILSIDEYEAFRLLDGENLTQEECASRMNIARTTVTAIYDNARKKIADVIVNGKRLLIAGGCCEYGPVEVNQNIMEKRSSSMRIAVTYENGEIFQHFGHTEQFKLYDIEDGRIVSQQVIDTNGYGHGALAGFLNAVKADVLICGGIGMGAQMAISDAGIRLCAGVSGSADKAAEAFAEGNLEFGSEANCNCHEHHHEDDCGHGHRGEHHSEDHHCRCH